MADDNGVQFGPFLPGQETLQETEEADESDAPLPPPPPPLLYPRGVCTAAWDKARIQLGLLLSRAAADVGASPSTSLAAVAAFHAGLPSFFHIDAAAVSACLAASLFLSGKAADEEYNLRRVVASLGFCGHHAAAAAQRERLQQQQQQHPHLKPKPHLQGEYVALGIKEYWRQRQSCFLEEQRLMQALSFSFPSPTLWQYLPLMLLLLRPTATEAAIASALVADAAAGPLAAEGDERVVVAAACLLARKLMRRFKQQIKQQSLEGQQLQQHQWLYPPPSPAAGVVAATPEQKAAAVETLQLLEDEINATAPANRPAEGESYNVILRLLPLLQGISSSSDQCSSRNNAPLCQQLAVATKKMLLQYALLLDDSKGHQVYRQLVTGDKD